MHYFMQLMNEQQFHNVKCKELSKKQKVLLISFIVSTIAFIFFLCFFSDNFEHKTKKKETCEIIFQDDSEINISFLRFNKIKKKPWHPFFVYKDSYIPVYMVYTYFIKERRSIRKFKAELPSKQAPRKEGRVVWAE